jgi:3'-5' exoribonuclease
VGLPSFQTRKFIMTRAKPTLVHLGDMNAGQFDDFFVLLAEKAKGKTREGKPFFTCRFRDARRSATSMIWEDGGLYHACERDWQEGQFYKIRGTFTPSDRFGPQIEIQDIRPITAADMERGFQPSDLVECSRFDPAAMLAELKVLAEKNIDDLPLRQLVLTILDRHAPALQRVPATLTRFHPFLGGLLEHTLAVTRSALELVERYRSYYPDLKPPLNRDLVTAGAILHDIGRVLEFDETLMPQPTVPGRLLGHLFLGRDLVRDTARELGNVKPELLQLLEHMIITHLNLPEWGSPRLPLIPESLILHHADDLDAKMEMYVRCLTRDQAAGPFTDREPGLNRQLFKGRSV